MTKIASCRIIKKKKKKRNYAIIIFIFLNSFFFFFSCYISGSRKIGKWRPIVFHDECKVYKYMYNVPLLFFFFFFEVSCREWLLQTFINTFPFHYAQLFQREYVYHKVPLLGKKQILTDTREEERKKKKTKGEGGR